MSEEKWGPEFIRAIVKTADIGLSKFVSEKHIPVRMVRGKVVERRGRVRVNRSPEYRNAVLSLSGPAWKLWTWICCEMTIDADRVWVNRKHFVSTIGVKEGIFRLAVRELCEKGFIQKVEENKFPKPIKDVFFVNPHYVFCGNITERFKHFLHFEGDVDRAK